jgi:histone H3/H4
MPPKKSSNPLAARIKRMMQRDEDVGKIAGPAPVVMSKALELFVAQLVRVCADVATLHGAKTVTGSHLKGAVGMVPEAFDFLSDIVESAADLPPPPDLATLEAELKAREEDGGKESGKRGKKRGGNGGDLGNLGDLTGGSLDAEPKTVKAKPRAKPKAAAKKTKTTKKIKKTEDDDFIDDEEDFVDEMSETDEEFDPDEIVPARETTRSRSGRVVRKRYTDGDDDESDEEPTKRRSAKVKQEAPMASLDGTGTLAGSLDAPFAGSLAATADDVGQDEDDYD